MKNIWKWALGAKTTIEIPKGAQILHVADQYNEPKLWALVDPANEKEFRHFSIYGTGHELPDNPGVFIGTFYVNNGTFVFHVFEEIKE